MRIGADDALSADVELALDPAAEPPLLERLAIPKRMFERTGTRTLVVFDEFQDVLTASDRADAVIRSEIQHHGDAASYVFAGSQLGMMRSLFADKRRALYGQARAVDLSPLDPEDVATYLDRRFRGSNREIGEALDPLLDLAQGHPSEPCCSLTCSGSGPHPAPGPARSNGSAPPSGRWSRSRTSCERSGPGSAPASGGR